MPQDQRYKISLLAIYDLRETNRRGSQVIVIHPGSRFIRIGKASDVNPVTVPCVVARKYKTPFVAQERVPLVSWPRKPSEPEAPAGENSSNGGDEHNPLNDPVSCAEDHHSF